MIIFFQKRTYAIAATPPPPTPVHKNTLLVVPSTHPLKPTYSMDGPLTDFYDLHFLKASP